MTENTKDQLDDLLERSAKDPSISLIAELRKITTKPEGIALIDDFEQRRDQLRERFTEAIDKKYVEFKATRETGDAIISYHKNIVLPLLIELIDEISGVQFELALHKSQLASRPVKFD